MAKKRGRSKYCPKSKVLIAHGVRPLSVGACATAKQVRQLQAAGARAGRKIRAKRVKEICELNKTRMARGLPPIEIPRAGNWVHTSDGKPPSKATEKIIANLDKKCSRRGKKS